MTSGTDNNELRECGLCKKKLRPLRANNDWDGRRYHIFLEYTIKWMLLEI